MSEQTSQEMKDDLHAWIEDLDLKQSEVDKLLRFQELFADLFINEKLPRFVEKMSVNDLLSVIAEHV